MTDKEKIVALAYDAGTLKRVYGSYVYIGDLRLRFNDAGSVIQASEPEAVRASGLVVWRDAGGEKKVRRTNRL